MRIRSIKPEYWRSPDINTLSTDDRLLFIGLWSYVDDNGVGRDEVAAIVADLFANDMFHHPRETVARVTGGLANLSEAGRIVRYTVENRPYLFVSNWEKHQRIDKPAKPRYPRPEGESTILATPSRQSRDTLAPGAGEQGNRGTGEQALSPFCQKHPEGTDAACGPCGTARTRYKAALLAEKTKPSPAVVAPKTCTVHAEYPLPCTRCEEGT